jgi:DNA primase large subunit
MPYSLHEKTALASVVLLKDEIEKFTPRDADPLKVKIRNYLPDNEEDEAKNLLSEALDWKRTQRAKEERVEEKRYSGKKFEESEMTGVTDEMYPKPIKKLLQGLEDGKKRGLFVLITFFRAVGFSPEEINKRIREWNGKNIPPLREGYVRSQIDWHLKQKRKILPPNYDNDGFYRDIGILEEKPNSKNPLVDVRRKLMG